MTYKDSLASIGVASILALICAPLAASAAHPDRFSGTLKMAEEFLTGTFDNYEQAYWEKVLDVPEVQRHRRRTEIYRKVDVPAIEGDKYYAHKYWDGDPKKPAYRNLWVLFGDKKLNAVRINLLTIPHPETLDNALNDPSILHDLTFDKLGSMPRDCDSLWEPRGNSLHMTLVPGNNCWLTDVNPAGMPVHTEVDATLNKDEFYFGSYGYDKDGILRYGVPGLIAAKLRHARWFSCTVERPGMKSTVVRLHDQGDAVTLDGSEANQIFTIRLRQMLPPYAVYSRELALLVMPGVATERVNEDYELLDPHSSTDPSAGSIGYETSHIGVRCDLKPQTWE